MKFKKSILSMLLRWRKKRIIVLGLTLFFLFFLLYQPISAMTIFSGGMQTPETISSAPNGFGNYGGDYFIPDPGRNFSTNPDDRNIWRVPANGGASSVFINNPDSWLVGGLFLPDTGWGSNSGKYLSTGWLRDPLIGKIFTYDSSGNVSSFLEQDNFTFTTPRIAPNSFGSYGGQLIVSDQESDGVVIVNQSAGLSVLTSNLGFNPFGLAFAPDNFGNFGGQLLVSGSQLLVSGERFGVIVAVDANGNTTPFASFELPQGQFGLRQMEFSSPSFISGFDQLLFVSVSGSQAGGGTLGDLLALDGNGDIIASLRSNLGLDKLDPRGLYFTGDGNLLISDASDPIWIASPEDFQRVPEPSTMLLLGSGLLGLCALRKKFRE